jgi:hypothetical protein
MGNIWVKPRIFKKRIGYFEEGRLFLDPFFMNKTLRRKEESPSSPLSPMASFAKKQGAG